MHNHPLAPSTPVFEFGPVRAGDAEVIAGWARTPQEARLWAGPGARWPVIASHLREWHADADIHPYVLLTDNYPVAYGEIWLDFQEQELELARLIVRPDLRGRGIGRRLVRKLIESAASTGLPVVFMRVAPENASALACYERCGFARVPDGDQRRYNQGQLVDYVWLTATLTSDASMESS
ncbi:MAG: GNAT family N-acetyltransferase [Actinomycetota bacterium]